MAIARFLSALAALVMLTGCAFSVATQNTKPGVTTKHYFGYVAVESLDEDPSLEGGVRTQDIESFGILIDDGFSVGYVKEDRVYVPMGCQTVFIVKSQRQLDWAVDRYRETLKGGNVCVAIEQE